MAGSIQAASDSRPDLRLGALKALAGLDALLERALAAANDGSVDGRADAYRGLYVTPEEADALLAWGPFGTPLRPVSSAESLEPEWVELVALGGTFGLADLDLDLLVVATAPDLDLRYERLFGFLQDDVTRRRPTVDLALELLSSSIDEKLACLERLDPSAPLLANRLLRIVPDPHHVDPPRLAHYLVPEQGIIEALLGRPRLHPQLAASASVVEPDARDGESAGGEARIVYLQGPAGCGQDEEAARRAAALGLLLLVVRTDLLPGPEAVSLALRDAHLLAALPYFKTVDTAADDVREALLDALARHRGAVVAAGQASWPAHRGPRGVRTTHFAKPVLDDRRAAWSRELAAVGVALPEPDVAELAGRFRLTYRQIEYAAAAAATNDRSLDALFAAARAQAGSELGGLARRVPPSFGWSDLVLPDEQLAQLRELCDRVRSRGVVQELWGFETKLSLARGVSVLFAGPSGTGKTMAAEVIARELRLDLFKIDLSSVVSKYIGETEKNLARVFAAAEETDAIIFFDEADALFGRRSEVQDSHDRYANVEISYLLQRMEEYDGIAILATNFRKNLDESFARRLHVVVEFPLPDEELRRRIWTSIWPREAPRDPSVDNAELARRLELSGGSIRNIALAAASLAAARGSVIGMTDVLHAARREYQKLGTIVDARLFSKDSGARP